MRVMLDIVPNHMGIGDVGNTWWMDVLENGPGSAYASYFDIEWKPVKPELENKVLIPILGDQYGRVLENGELKLTYEDGAFFISYYEHRFPVAPSTYRHVLAHPLNDLTAPLGEESDALQEYHSILTAISYLPPRTEQDPARRQERNREKEVIKRRIDTLYQEDASVRAAIDRAVQTFNGKVGEPRSFDLLDTLFDEQSYRLTFWRVAAEEINELAAIRTEDPAVFEDTHRLIFRLLREGKIHGLRIDHIDGLFDPAAYVRQLQEGYVYHLVRERLEQTRSAAVDDEQLARRVALRIDEWLAERQGAEHASRPPWPLYVVAEKILSEDEPLPHNWAVHGTTGYDYLVAANNLFVDSSNRQAFDTLYQQFVGTTRTFHSMVNSNKKMIMLMSMDSEMYALSHQLERIAERNRRYRDFTLNTLTFALRETIACLPVYRTYLADPDPDHVLPRDRQYIEAAVAAAQRANPRTAAAVFDFLRDTLLLRNLDDFGRSDASEEHNGLNRDQQQLILWVRKFQQLTGPVMAKGVEDTTFYVYNRLVSLNEVGGHPVLFGSGVESFHERCSETQRFWPHTLLASSTHDTKRSEDVRARINVLSEMPAEWQAALLRWRAMNASKKSVEREQEGGTTPAPDANDEYLLYQSLVGAWPFALLEPAQQAADNAAWDTFRERMVAYMYKAVKEAKVHTSWVQANDAYDQAVQTFVRSILCDNPDDAFLADIRALVRHVAGFGISNSLAQTTLKLTTPGVPDIYQGTEMWDFSLVDPDNRRAVDYAHRKAVLDDLTQRVAAARGNTLVPLVRELLEQQTDGRIKLYLVARLLDFRRAHEDLFLRGSYIPLEASGERAAHVCAFARSSEEHNALIIVPRLVRGLCRGIEQPPLGASVWGNTWLALPDGNTAVGTHYRNVLTGEVVETTRRGDAPVLRMGEVLATFPVALLERAGES